MCNSILNTPLIETIKKNNIAIRFVRFENGQWYIWLYGGFRNGIWLDEDLVPYDRDKVADLLRLIAKHNDVTIMPFSILSELDLNKYTILELPDHKIHYIKI